MAKSSAWFSLLVGLVGVGACSKSTATPGAEPDAASDAGAVKSQWLWRGGDLGSSYTNPGETALTVDNAADLAEAWTYTTKGQPTGVAAVVDGQVYLTANGGLAALDTEGNELWTSPDGRATSSPTFHEGTIYVNDLGATLHAISAADGTELWGKKIDDNANAYGFSSPTVFESLVIVGSSSGEETVASSHATFHGALVAYNKDSGDEVWRHVTSTAPSNGASVWSSPAIDAEARMVFAATGNNYTEDPSDTSDAIFALNVDTGAQVWNTQITAGDVYTTVTMQSADSDFGANPILFEATIGGTKRKMVGAGQKSGTFSALDRMTGEVLWQEKLSPGSALIGGIFASGAFDGERILVAANQGASTGPGSEPSNGESGGARGVSRLLALDPADGTILWERQIPAWSWSPITVANGVGFVSFGKHFQAFNAKTGEKLATFDTNGTVASGASIVDGHVYFGSGLAYYGSVLDTTFHCLALP